MNDSTFQKLLDRANKAAQKHNGLMSEVGEECERRYRKHYSDVDADWIIDSIDYGRGPITVSQFHEDMTNGYVAEKPPEWEEGQ